jgi:hypothetical protein
VETRLLGSGLGEDGVLTVVLVLDRCPVGGLELGRRDESDLAVKASVVEPVDVLDDGDLDVADALPAPLGRMRGLRMHSALNSELNASAIALS